MLLSNSMKILRLLYENFNDILKGYIFLFKIKQVTQSFRLGL